MAIALTSINKSEGLTSGGVFVEIDGSGFYVAPSAVRPDGKPAPSVKVKFGSFTSPKAFATSSTKVYAEVPKYTSGAIDSLPALVDVSVENYDVSETLTGDTDTLTGVFTYKRPALNSESALTDITRSLIVSLMNQVTRETYWVVDTDYDEMVLDGFAFVRDRKKPAFVLTGPEMPINEFYSTNAKCQVGTGTGVDIFFGTQPMTVDLNWAFIGVAPQNKIMLNMATSVMNYFNSNQFLSTADGTEYELEFANDGISVETVANKSNLHWFSGSFSIKGVMITQTLGEPGIDDPKDVFKAVEGLAREVDDICIVVDKKA